MRLQLHVRIYTTSDILNPLRLSLEPFIQLLKYSMTEESTKAPMLIGHFRYIKILTWLQGLGE